MAKIQARVLTGFNDGETKLLPNDLISGEAAIIKSLEKAGNADTNKAAVDYVKSQGAKVKEVTGQGVDIAAAELAGKIEAIKTQIADLEVEFNAAPEADKLPIRKKIDGLTNELTALG